MTMKRLLAMFLLGMVTGIVILGCSMNRAIYGIPEAQWQSMSQTERQIAIERFKQQEKINAATRIQADQARAQAAKLCQQCQNSTEEANSAATTCPVITHRQWGF